MAISPVNISRISHNLQASLVVNSLQRNQREVFTEQTRIATGREFVTPSEDPVAAGRVLDLTRAMQQQDQFMANLRHADNSLAAADDALTEVNSLLIEAHDIASANISNLTSAAERESAAELIAGIRIQLQSVGNRLFNGRFLFAGRDTTERPFVEALGGIAYVGDTGDLLTRIDRGQDGVINLPGNVLFGALSGRLASNLDLSPSLTPDTRLEDLNGAGGHGIRRGTLVINEINGAGVFQVDLTAADTIGDVADLITAAAAAAGADVTATVSATGLDITPGGGDITVTDTGTGVAAADLGVLTTTPTSTPITGAALAPRLTRLTPVSALAQGGTIDLAGGLVITNGPQTATIDLTDAETVQDIINRINNAGVYALARINDAGTGIDVFNQVSGAAMSISENGGTTAADLGLLTLAPDTPVSSLHGGRGLVLDPAADDLRITAKDGSTFDVNLDGVLTVDEVLTRINDAAVAAGVNVTAALATTGSGLVLSDGTGGAGTLSALSLNSSQAAYALGLTGTAGGTATDLVGDNPNPVKTEGILTALVELEDALRRDDTLGISQAADRLDPFTKDVTRVHGIIGARSQSMRSHLGQMQDAAGAAGVFLSEVQDLDYAEAITRMQSAVTQLQANLRTSSLLLNVSLLDFLQ